MEQKNSHSRRTFLKNAAAFAAFSAAAPYLPVAAGLPAAQSDHGGAGCTFLFQGDSITDGNRTRNLDWNHVMGHGYQYIIASKLWYDFPAKGFHFFNRGVSGNKVTDLAARWQKDTIDIKPDVLSILIGINDATAGLGGNKDFTVEQYESGYRSLLEQAKRQLPGVQFVLCSPFVLPVGKVKEQWESYSSEVQRRQQVVQRLSADYGAVYINFQQAFDKALQKAPAAYWIWDGIHPMPAGHELMAREWMRQVSRKLQFIR